MILDISDSMFRDIFKDKRLHLPIRWDGNDFQDSLRELFFNYLNAIENSCDFHYEETKIGNITSVCELISIAVKHYLDGFPARAYKTFTRLMGILQQMPLKVYQKSCMGREPHYDDRLNLFRVANVDDNKNCARTRIFHTPYNMRSKVSTSRYSIAGYPSLYLGTSLELCCEEVQYNPYKGPAIASKFKLERNIEINRTEINVIELALKPQDFLEQNRNNDFNRRFFDEIDLTNKDKVRRAYLLWYPLIAACSFIRTNKSHPFAVEYIIPQLLMQWLRCEMSKENNRNYGRLIGIRYFSCASVRASDMGFNYVFPVSGEQISAKFPYCPILSKSFYLTKPHFIKDYPNIESCEFALIDDNDIDFVNT